MGTRPRKGRDGGTTASVARTPASVVAPPETRRLAWFALALAMLTVVLYAGVWSFDYVQFDDPTYVVQNPNIADGLTWPDIRWAFTADYASNWHPLTWLSHMLDLSLFGLQAGPSHLVNLGLHTISVVLLFWLLARITGAAGRSAMVAALFAVHPLHVESVAWISERKDVLSTVFWMLTMWAYVRYVRRPSSLRYLAALGVFGLGLMAKPMLVTLPFVLLLLDWWPLRRWAGIREKLPFFGLAALSSVVTFAVQHGTGAVATLDRIPAALRIENAVVSYASYIGMMLWPAGLCAYYPHPAALPLARVAACAAILAVITAAAIITRRTRPWLAVGWLWYLGTLVPVIGLVQVGRQALADRYTYVPLVGLFIIAAWGAEDLLARWPPRRWVLPLAACATLLGLSMAARAQIEFWRDDSALFTRALSVNLDLDDHRARLAADDLVADKWFPALQALLEARERGRASLNPATARYLLGGLYLRHKQAEEAVLSFSDAIRLQPEVPEFHRDLGLALSAQGKSADAVNAYLEALRLDPRNAEAQNDLGFLLAGLGRSEEAIPHFAEATRLKPDSPDTHRNLAMALANAGRIGEAMTEFRAVLRLKPDDATARRILDEYARRGKTP